MIRTVLTPLKIFVVGEFFILGAMLLFPALGTASNQLAADTANMTGTFWGWGWVMTSGFTRLLVFLALQAGVLWGVGSAFIHARDKK